MTDPVPVDSTDSAASEEPAPAADFSRRRLCPDGTCVGVLDAEGRCPVCGVFGGAEEDPGPAVTPAVTVASVDGTTEAESGFNPARRLCPDGACLGVITPEGRCSVCGRPDEGLA